MYRDVFATHQWKLPMWRRPLPTLGDTGLGPLLPLRSLPQESGERFRGKRLTLVLTGGNVDFDRLPFAPLS